MGRAVPPTPTSEVVCVGNKLFGGAWLYLRLSLCLTWSNHVRTRLCHFLWKWPFGKTLLCFTILPQRTLLVDPGH